jgi:hypothetical protein
VFGWTTTRLSSKNIISWLYLSVWSSPKRWVKLCKVAFLSLGQDLFAQLSSDSFKQIIWWKVNCYQTYIGLTWHKINGRIQVLVRESRQLWFYRPLLWSSSSAVACFVNCDWWLLSRVSITLAYETLLRVPVQQSVNYSHHLNLQLTHCCLQQSVRQRIQVVTMSYRRINIICGLIDIKMFKYTFVRKFPWTRTPFNLSHFVETQLCFYSLNIEEKRLMLDTE